MREGRRETARPRRRRDRPRPARALTFAGRAFDRAHSLECRRCTGRTQQPAHSAAAERGSASSSARRRRPRPPHPLCASSSSSSRSVKMLGENLSSRKKTKGRAGRPRPTSSSSVELTLRERDPPRSAYEAFLQPGHFPAGSESARTSAIPSGLVPMPKFGRRRRLALPGSHRFWLAPHTRSYSTSRLYQGFLRSHSICSTSAPPADRTRRLAAPRLARRPSTRCRPTTAPSLCTPTRPRRATT